MTIVVENTRLNVWDFFNESGKLAQLVPGYQTRPEQIKVAEAIQSALYTPTHCLAEAGTGVGKSLAYLVPGIDWALGQNSRLVVSTHTKALQSQLMTKELPRLAKEGMFSRPFTYEICLGAENYVCLHRLLQEGNQELLPGFHSEYLQGLRTCLAWCREPVSGLRQDYPETMPDTLWQRICVVNDLCLGKTCAYFDECFLQMARHRQRAADVLVANHYLFFANLKTSGRLLPDFKAVVLDEAHKLEDVATHFMEDSLSQIEVQQVLHEIGRKGKSHLLDFLTGIEAGTREKIREQILVLATKQEYWWKSLLELFNTQADTRRIQNSNEPMSVPDTELALTLARDLAELQDLTETEEESKALAYYAARLSEITVIEQHWYARASQDNVYWVEKAKSRQGPLVRIHTTPLDLSSKLEAMLFQSVPSVILTSATLAVGKDFSYVRARLGITNALEVVVNSPFLYQEHAALYLPEVIPDPRNLEAFEQYVQRAVEELIAVFQGGMFVLCTSYRMMHRVAEYLRNRDSRHVYLVQGEAAPQRLIEYFQKDQHAVMLGVETFWQGVDIPGDALRCVVITRLPFDVPTHPVHQARAQYLETQGKNPFHAYSIPRAALMLRQGFGRLIRSDKDKGIVAVLDPRIRTREWGEIFLSTLPTCPQLATLHQVQDFVDNHFALED